MNQVNLSQAWRRCPNAFDPAQQFGAVTVCAVAVQHFDLRAQRNLFAKDPDRRSLLDDPSAKCVLGLEAYYKDCVARIGRTVGEVVNNAS